MKDSLIFIYNADAGLLADILGIVTKTIAPSAYSCNLCQIIHGTLSMKKEWRVFLESLPYKKIFLHKDELKNTYTPLASYSLPAIFLQHGNSFSLILSAEEINAVEDIIQLKNLLTEKLKKHER